MFFIKKIRHGYQNSYHKLLCLATNFFLCSYRNHWVPSALRHNFLEHLCSSPLEEQALNRCSEGVVGGLSSNKHGPPGPKASFCSWERKRLSQVWERSERALNPRGRCYFHHTGTAVQSPEQLPNLPRRMQAPAKLKTSNRHSRQGFPHVRKLSCVSGSLVLFLRIIDFIFFCISENSLKIF